MILLIFASKLY